MSEVTNLEQILNSTFIWINIDIGVNVLECTFS